MRKHNFADWEANVKKELARKSLQGRGGVIFEKGKGGHKIAGKGAIRPIRSPGVALCQPREAALAQRLFLSDTTLSRNGWALTPLPYPLGNSLVT